MAYQVLHVSPRCWQVVNKETGTIHAKCTTKTKAMAQMRLLYGVEKGTIKPRQTKKTMNPWIEHVKKVAKEQGLSYPKALKIASASYVR